MSLKDAICKMCGRLMDEAGNLIGEMVFGDAERGDHICRECKERLQWPSR